jgi:hypothetical protein
MVQDRSDDTGLPVGKVRAAVEVVPVNDTQVNLECTGAKIPLIQFRARGPEPSRGRGRGVSYSLPKGRNRLPHAFISTMPNTYRGVFERTGRFKTFQVLNRKTGHSTTQRREIIREVLGPSLVKVFENHLPQGMERADESLTENLRHEVEFVLSRR